MSISLGNEPWLLIVLTPLELLFIFVPSALLSIVKDTTIKEQVKELFLLSNKDSLSRKDLTRCTLSHIGGGLLIGCLMFLSAGYILLFFKTLMEFLLGTAFLTHAREGAISTDISQPTIMQLFLLIVIQISIVAPSEEVFFRRFLVLELNNKVNYGSSVVISSLLFSLYHVPPFLVPLSTTITFLGYYFILGVILSLAFLYLKNGLISVIFAHALFNILVILL